MSLSFRNATPEDAERLDHAGFAPIIGQITSREMTTLHRVITCCCGPACAFPGQHPRAHSWPSTAEALRKQLPGSNLLLDFARTSLVIVNPTTQQGFDVIRPLVDREEFWAPCWEISVGPFAGRYHVFRDGGRVPQTTVEVMGCRILGRDHRPIPLPGSDLGQEPATVERLREGGKVFMRSRDGQHHVVTWARSPWGITKPRELPTAVAEALARAEQVAKPDASNVIEFRRASRKRS
jgi:hypothetical protein